MSTDLSVAELSKELQAAIEDLRNSEGLQATGVVTRVGDGVAWIYGLSDAGFNEVVAIDTADGGAAEAFVLNLMEDEIGAVLLAPDAAIIAGANVHLAGKVLEVPVGPEMVGRVVDPLGRPLDGLGPINTKETSPLERKAPGVMARKGVHEPVMTGIMSIDTMIPVGRGQRELIIGDRQTGKTAIAVDTMINQKRQNTGIINVYVAIGQKSSKVAALVERLKREGVMEQTIVVATSPADPAPLLYLAPYAGCAMGEWFRDNSKHALIIYDDLSKHAVAYRQMSLLLRRPPGREAYPGDVFYIHSRLLERAAKLNDKLGGGSLTALPIIETQAGDISAYIPTNVISITDGQIFLETSLFYQGIRPAISVGLSVSRVGGDAQTKAIKSVSSSLKLSLAQFRELASFAQFSTDLDPETKQQIERGQRLTELFKQRQYSPLSIAEQVVAIVATTNGAFDAVPAPKIKEAASDLYSASVKAHKKLIAKLNEGTKPEDEDIALIVEEAKKVARSFTPEKSKHEEKPKG
jgi:F-type H+-transporting ATPase subunit alpha